MELIVKTKEEDVQRLKVSRKKVNYTFIPHLIPTFRGMLSSIYVELNKNQDDSIILKVIDEGVGFKEKDTKKIFKRFYSNRPEKFGEHSGLGLNIVKNLVELHNGVITASNNKDDKGAKIEITFPSINLS